MDFSLRIRVNVDRVCLGGVKEQFATGLGVWTLFAMLLHHHSLLVIEIRFYQTFAMFLLNIDIDSEAHDWLIKCCSGSKTHLKIWLVNKTVVPRLTSI